MNNKYIQDTRAQEKKYDVKSVHKHAGKDGNDQTSYRSCGSMSSFQIQSGAQGRVIDEDTDEETEIPIWADGFLIKLKELGKEVELIAFSQKDWRERKVIIWSELRPIKQREVNEQQFIQRRGIKCKDF